MSWIGLLLIGFAVSDLVFSARAMRVVPEVVGAVTAVLVGVGIAGLTEPRDVAAVLVIAGVVVAWGQTVTRGFGPGPPWLPLVVGGGGLLLAVAVSGWAGEAGGPLASWLEGSGLPGISALSADRALVLAGLVLVQLSTGNVVVRLVLAATGSRNPSRLRSVPDHGRDDPRPLKGGRLLGPMERLLIVGLGLAGQVTATALVIAAKGLLRYPELQATARDEREPGIHEVTEYFLVGSFASWLIALSAVVLAAAA